MAEDKQNITKMLLIGAVVVIVVIIGLKLFNKNATEGFELPQNVVIESQAAQPNLAALPVSPRSNLPGLNGQSLLGTPQNMDTMAAPPQPVMQAMPQQAMPADFSAMGAAQQVPNAAMTSQQAQSALANKVGTNTPQWQDPQLPLQDIGNMSTDPTNPMSPENFMYTRTIFSPLKRRYGNQVDMIRGDLDIKPAMRGYFDIAKPTEKDIVKGYFADYLDVQQSAAVRDAAYTRNIPADSMYANSINPAGDSYRAVYLNV